MAYLSGMGIARCRLRFGVERLLRISRRAPGSPADREHRSANYGNALAADQLVRLPPDGTAFHSPANGCGRTAGRKSSGQNKAALAKGRCSDRHVGEHDRAHLASHRRRCHKRARVANAMKLITNRRLVITFVLIAVLAVGGLLAMSTWGSGVGASSGRFDWFFAGRLRSFFQQQKPASEPEQTIVVTTPMIEDVMITESFVCQIRSRRHIEVRALEGGYLEKILINEGQAVKKGSLMFQILPVLYKAKLDAENAKAELAALKYKYTQELASKKVVSENELALSKVEMAEAQAKATQAAAELNFTDIRAAFDGIVDRLLQREGSLIKEGDILTTLADNSEMWVYFNVPEKYYLHYMAARKEREKDKIELVLADGETFPQPGKINAIEADFNNQNGNIKFRADFANPDGLLRHGQTGTIKIQRSLKNALVIPQRATFDILDKRYVWVVDKNDTVHQTLITVTNELEDIFVVGSGLGVGDKIVLEGVREVEEGQKVQYEFVAPEEALKHQKFHAE
ncbi:MAG TPA: efflux RND transporter periplasmic adaptor subunit [Pirellulales bacterium]|nr:efflux RND transporter periplasmic adaptor subunit [Pirellulales bacterium]